MVGLLWTGQAQAQLAVIDAANLRANSFTGFQAFISATEAVIHTANWALDLTGYSESGLDAGFYGDLQLLEEIFQEGQALMWDIRSLETQIATLLGLEGAPDSTGHLRDRMFEIRAWQHKRYMYAARTQSIMSTGIRAVQRLANILGKLLEILGDKQGMQNITEALGQLNQIELNHATAAAAAQSSEITDKMQPGMLQESIRRINAATMADYPQ